jgi:threonine/homoserine/homoserine lactone efflux protein
MFLLEGFLIGLATLFVIGPVLFILINATIKNGTRSGISVAFGIFIGDLIYAILILINGIDFLINNTFLNSYLSLIGFVILFSFGLIYTFKKDTKNKLHLNQGKKTHIQNFIKGFSINFFNPFVLSFWLLMTKYGSDKYSVDVNYFLIAIVIGILIIDIIKVFLSKKLNSMVHSKKILLFYKISGIVMILFSFRMLYHYFTI